MNKLRRLFVLLLVCLGCALFATGCDDVISDPNFHTWCGDQLCSWKLESGQIAKVPTWNKNDYGVELLDSNEGDHTTAISQTVDKSPSCLEFSVIADVAAEAQVSILVDFDADGTVEHPQPIAALGFQEQKYQVTAPLHYSGIKFTIIKTGRGRAVLAQMDVHEKTDCTAAPEKLKPQALGGTCRFSTGYFTSTDDPTACDSGICCEGRCAECCVSANPPHDADGGLVPDPANTCSDGGACAKLPLFKVSKPSGSLDIPDLDVGGAIPRQCDPGKRKRAAGAECLLPEDCTSGVCDDAVWTLVNTEIDGGACPAPPAYDPSCTVSSVRGGICR